MDIYGNGEIIETSNFNNKLLEELGDETIEKQVFFNFDRLNQETIGNLLKNNSSLQKMRIVQFNIPL